MSNAWIIPFNPNNIHHITLVNCAIANADRDQRGRISAAREKLADHGIAPIQPNDDRKLEQLVVDLSEWR